MDVFRFMRKHFFSARKSFYIFIQDGVMKKIQQGLLVLKRKCENKRKFMNPFTFT